MGRMEFVFYARPHLCPLPSVFAVLRRDRAEAKGEGGQERIFAITISGFRMSVRPIQSQVFPKTRRT